jgi:hypothetical protein
MPAALAAGILRGGNSALRGGGGASDGGKRGMRRAGSGLELRTAMRC